MRESKTCGEEELYCSGKVAVHSKGNPSSRILQTTYTCETDIKHALWCTFHTSTVNQTTNNVPKGENRNEESINCICLLDSYTLKVFTEGGEDYVSSLQFQVNISN